MAIKPILFNTKMVQAILDGRKTVTRRVIKVPPYYPYFYKLHDNSDGALTGTKNRLFAGFYDEDKIFYIDGEKHIDAVYYQASYQPGDALYVRETFCPNYFDENIAGYRNDGLKGNRNVYKADYNKAVVGDTVPEPKWHPSIHMPKEAARIWLRVTDVRVERLQEITLEQARSEGCDGRCNCPSSGADGSLSCETRDFSIERFETLWDSTIKKSDLDRYGWYANPWVWVIEFERCEKPENLLRS